MERADGSDSQRGGTWGGSVMLPVDPPLLGCMGSAGDIAKDFRV